MNSIFGFSARNLYINTWETSDFMKKFWNVGQCFPPYLIPSPLDLRWRQPVSFPVHCGTRRAAPHSTPAGQRVTDGRGRRDVWQRASLFSVSQRGHLYLSSCPASGLFGSVVHSRGPSVGRQGSISHYCLSRKLFICFQSILVHAILKFSFECSMTFENLRYLFFL